MKEIVTYLTFDGDCHEAMQFYADALGGTLHLMTAGESGQGIAEDKDRILHAKIALSKGSIMASDTMRYMPYALKPGNNFALSLDCESLEEQDRFFANLSAGGSISMALQDTFWGARFGMLVDKFGIAWMFNFDKSQA